MEKSRLKWDDVSRFEQVKGFGQSVWKDGSHYYFVTEEGGTAPQRVVYELSDYLFNLLESGQKTRNDIHFKLKNDCWPPTEEEINKVSKKRVEERPIVLISNPKNLKLFTQEELENLIPIAEQQWIEWKRKLPDNYISPLVKQDIVLDTATIDSIGVVDGHLELLLADGNAWLPETEQDHLLKLQEKLNNYIHFIESKQYAEGYGDDFIEKVINLTFQYAPSDNGLAFLVQVQKVLQPTDICLKVVVPE
ncbi:hypothetical protein HO757_04215 [Streptococcus suis]|uniref:Uncharacterized protein n=1 Tax=Streptococcus suis TaxID=1307 RepID=A0A0Z8SK44_STRSU|nr:DUF6572 domain-containing protein [Streptococcus suis]NQN60246.1 hypothetical protein [Streptococcus suis]NQP75144.1 hypothetical protein [Streptococcus suis]NQP77250.1 hypothetical protein [Streptococcus suis]NQP91623.1 hypothetical protein [Streptococcus suis]NQP93545.1 hypothetical protein [Streptococcus suis]